jgi:hypothetical protein
VTDTATRPAPGRQHDVEDWLNGHHIPWRYEPDLAVGDVDANASLANQARLEALSEEVVDRYAADMERGDTFPPIVVNRIRSRRGERLVLVGGNHRLTAALRAGVPTLAAYVIDAPPELVFRLTIEDNRRHGYPPTESERTMQAAHLVALGYSRGDAAAICGISIDKVQRHFAVTDVDTRASGLGIARWERVPKTTRYRLGAVRSDTVFEAIARHVIDGTLANVVTVIGELVARANKAATDADALAIVEHTVATAKAKGDGRSNTARSRLLGGLGTVRFTDPAEVAGSCATSVQRVDLAKRIDDTIRHLQAVKKALG